MVVWKTSKCTASLCEVRHKSTINCLNHQQELLVINIRGLPWSIYDLVLTLVEVCIPISALTATTIHKYILPNNTRGLGIPVHCLRELPHHFNAKTPHIAVQIHGNEYTGIHIRPTVFLLQYHACLQALWSIATKSPIYTLQQLMI